MKFESKIDWWFYLTAFAMLLSTTGVFLGYFQSKLTWLLFMGFEFLFCTVFLIIPMLFTTYCTLFPDYLYVRCWIYYSKKIPYSKITGVYQSTNYLAAPTLSMDRLDVAYYNGNKKKTAIISPKHKNEFLQQIAKKINTNT
jgi:hypothetical protein